LFCKNLLLNSDKIIEDYIKNSSDSNLKNKYNKLKKIKHDYLFLTYDSVKAVKLKSEIERQEDCILHYINDLQDMLLISSKNWQDVKNSLSDGEYAVEFSQMFAPEKNNGSGTDTLYCAFVIGKNYKSPILEFCIDAKPFDSIYFAKKYDPITCNEIYINRTMALYTVLFKHLEQHMPDACTIYYSPCGYLSQLNFDLFTDENGKPLNQKYKMVRVSSTANIPEIKSLDIKSFKTSALYGGIDYKNSITNSDVAVRGVDFKNLPNTGTEIKSVAKILTAANIKTDTICGENATEESFKKLSGNSPDILHIATHGFYLEDDSNKPFAQSVNTYSQKESAMALSGLALSGANNAWKGNFDLPNVEDGILTAYEISQLDLSNTKLVVLSACETARGRIFPVDGVFGLQRAFKQAGAGSILMSLWKVDDNATATFMEYFYKFLFATNDRHKALQMAQDEVKKQYPDPYYWAAWVMLD
ncbi:MAG: CHAT domain-containing protein, partial [Bacteroidales bacterium]|nr:CHAT domain-containing protein [Bacteroidales bacterium]